MNRRSAATPRSTPDPRDGDSGEWQDWLVDESPTRRRRSPRARSSITAARRCPNALTVLNKRERRIFETRRLAEERSRLVELAEEFGVSASGAPDRGERLREGAERSEAPRRGDGDPGPCSVSSNPSPVVGETDDGRVALSTFLRQPNDARGRRSPVLIQPPSLDDPCTALCIIDRALSARCRWKVIRSFIMKSGSDRAPLAAASSSALGINRRKITHTSTSKMGDASEIVCPYCLYRYSASIPSLATRI